MRQRRAGPDAWLAGAAAGSGLVALLHLAVIFAGPEAYAFFGVPDLGARDAAGSGVPDLITSGLVLVFTAWAWYPLAALSPRVWRPPLLRAGLATIGAVYTLRGASVVPQLIDLITRPSVPPRFVVFSSASLVLGICYLVGFARWRSASI